MGRRAFVKRTGAATVGTAIALHGFRMEVMASESSGIWYIDALPGSGNQPATPSISGPDGDFSYQFIVVTVDGLANAPIGSVTVEVRLISRAPSGYPGCSATIPLGSLAGAVLDGIINCDSASDDPINHNSGWIYAGPTYTPHHSADKYFRYEISNGQRTLEGDGTGFVFSQYTVTVKMYEAVTFVGTGFPGAAFVGGLQESHQILFGASLEAKLSE